MTLDKNNETSQIITLVTLLQLIKANNARVTIMGRYGSVTILVTLLPSDFLLLLLKNIPYYSHFSPNISGHF